MEETEFNIRVVSLRDKMFRFARSLLQRHDGAEDVTQETLEKLWVRRAGLDTCRDVEAFVMTVVRNGCYDRLRRPHPLGGESLPNLAVEADAARCEAREVVVKAMEALTVKQRGVLHLKEIEGYTTQEIAHMMGIEENQIRTILSRARKGLREAINNNGVWDGR